MRPIRLGDRGPAVEDVQRRLRLLGYDLGPTGIDGVFFGRTAEAVRAFQIATGLAEDALVGDETWSALVDATFTLGNRMLYLRLPHFHGDDVRVLQQALNALGFACGTADAIFGSYTERALAEFQRNSGLVADGIAGDETVRALVALRHVWEGKDPRAHSAATVAPGRAENVLGKVAFSIRGLDRVGVLIAERIVNLACATTPLARVSLIDAEGDASKDSRFELCVCGTGTARSVPGLPIVRLDTDVAHIVTKMITALESTRARQRVVVEADLLDDSDEHELQRTAVRVLDAVCAVFDESRGPW